MSGHSKWSTIKHKKAAKDAKRGKLFTKFIKEITVAARMGGGDMASNPRLRTAVQTARDNSMPNDNIERAIKKGTGDLEGVSYEEVSYEGYGPGGVALFIEATTDNQKRTVAEVRHLLDKNGGNLGTNGSVAWQFDRKGQIYIDAARHDEEAVLEAALEAGAEDVADSGGEFIVTTGPAALHRIREGIAQAGIGISQAEITMIPRSGVAVSGSEAERLVRLLEALDGNDDVQKVSSNAEFDEAVLAGVA